MNDIQLSPHFKLSEFVKSSTAKARGIDNTPSQSHISNIQYLCLHILEPLRMHFNTPIIISSGYRCPLLNHAVGGVNSSNHLTGCAADLRIPSIDVGRQWFLWIMDNCKFDELIWEHSTPNSKDYWIHVAIRQNTNNRQRVVQNLSKFK